jgi:hypothetical protein
MVDALRAYCRVTGLRLADVYNEYGADEYDGIHPRNAGHQHIADAYIKAIQGEPSVSKIRARITAADCKCWRLHDHGDRHMGGGYADGRSLHPQREFGEDPGGTCLGGM